MGLLSRLIVAVAAFSFSAFGEVSQCPIITGIEPIEDQRVAGTSADIRNQGGNSASISLGATSRGKLTVKVNGEFNRKSGEVNVMSYSLIGREFQFDIDVKTGMSELSETEMAAGKRAKPIYNKKTIGFKVIGFQDDYRDRENNWIYNTNFGHLKIMITEIDGERFVDPIDAVSINLSNSDATTTIESEEGKSDEEEQAAEATATPKPMLGTIEERRKALQEIVEKSAVEIDGRGNQTLTLKLGDIVPLDMADSDRLFRLAPEGLGELANFDTPLHWKQYVPLAFSREDTKIIESYEVRISKLKNEMGASALATTLRARNKINKVETRIANGDIEGAEATYRGVVATMDSRINDIREQKYIISRLHSKVVGREGEVEGNWIKLQRAVKEIIDYAEQGSLFLRDGELKELKAAYATRRKVEISAAAQKLLKRVRSSLLVYLKNGAVRVHEYSLFVIRWEQRKQTATPEELAIYLGIEKRTKGKYHFRHAPDPMEVFYHIYSSADAVKFQMEHRLKAQQIRKAKIETAIQLGRLAELAPSVLRENFGEHYFKPFGVVLERLPVMRSIINQGAKEIVDRLHGDVIKYDIEGLMLDMAVDRRYSALLEQTFSDLRQKVQDGNVTLPPSALEPMKVGMFDPAWTPELIRKIYNTYDIDSIEPNVMDIAYYQRLTEFVTQMDSYDPIVVAYRIAKKNLWMSLLMKRMELAAYKTDKSEYNKFKAAKVRADQLGMLNPAYEYSDLVKNQYWTVGQKIRRYGVLAVVLAFIPSQFASDPWVAGLIEEGGFWGVAGEAIQFLDLNVHQIFQEAIADASGEASGDGGGD